MRQLDYSFLKASTRFTKGTESDIALVSDNYPKEVTSET